MVEMLGTDLNEGCELGMEVATEKGSKVLIEVENGVENISGLD